MTQTPLLTNHQADLLVFGYIRNTSKKLNVNIPSSLSKLMMIWYHEPAKILQFSDVYCSENSFKFTKNRTMITRHSEKHFDGHKYILADIKPLFEGIHCFRVQTTTYKSGWISWGVGEHCDLSDHSWGVNNSWNVACNHWSTGCDKCKHSDKDKYFLDFIGMRYIDILLDCDNGEMCIKCIDPNQVTQNHEELKCWEMPSKANNYKNNQLFKGYVAQFNVHDDKTMLQLAQIPVSCYGVLQEFNIFEND